MLKRFLNTLEKSPKRLMIPAFTLSEVMITMAVIGIVAALIIPRFVDNIYKHVWSNNLLQTYAKLSEGFSHIMAAEQSDKIADTEVFSAIGGDGICSSEMDPNGTECKEFLTKLKKYFKISSIKPADYKNINALENSEAVFCPTYFDNFCFDFNDYSNNTIILNDGTVIYYYSFSKHSLNDNVEPHNKISIMLVDINGQEKPNRFGRDIFLFNLSEEGKVLQSGSEDHAKLIFTLMLMHFDIPDIQEQVNDKGRILNYKLNEYDMYYPCYSSETDSYEYTSGGEYYANGLGCAGYVIQDKKMKY